MKFNYEIEGTIIADTMVEAEALAEKIAEAARDDFAMEHAAVATCDVAVVIESRAVAA